MIEILPASNYPIPWMRCTNYPRLWNYINRSGRRMFGFRIWRVAFGRGAPQIEHPNHNMLERWQ